MNADCNPINLNPEAKRQFWQDHLSQWRQSGQSQNDYCRQNGLKQHQLTYWKKRLVPTDVQEISFVPLKLVANLLGPADNSSIALFTPNGYKILVCCGFDPATLTQLIATVQAL